MKKKKGSTKALTAAEFDEKFDNGESIIEYLDLSTARINLDLPSWAIHELTTESNRVGVARQALIKVWLIDRLDALRKERKPRK